MKLSKKGKLYNGLPFDLIFSFSSWASALLQ